MFETATNNFFWDSPYLRVSCLRYVYICICSHFQTIPTLGSNITVTTIMPSPLLHVDKYLREMMDIRKNSGQHKCHISCRQKKGNLCPRPVPHAWPQWAHKRARTRTTENPPPVAIATKILFTKIEQVNPNKIALPYPIFCMQTIFAIGGKQRELACALTLFWENMGQPIFKEALANERNW